MHALAERSFAALRTFTDEHIEHWARVYLDHHVNRILRARRCGFETFLLAPREILAAIGRPLTLPNRAGLLPAQRDVQRRLDLDRALQELADRAVRAMPRESHCADGRWTGKTRHHAWPRRAPRLRQPKETT